MAYNLGMTERMGDARFRASSNSSDESPFTFYKPTLNINPKRLSASILGDTRASLQRRFTTQSLSTISGMTNLSQQRRQQPVELPVPDNHISIVRKAQLLEKKQAEYDFLRQKQLQFQHEMDLMARQVKQEEEEVQRLRHDLGNVHAGAGHQSEPTTPPEYRESGFPSALSRPNRFSSSSIMSPPGIINRPSRAGSQVTSPPVERARAYQALTAGPPSQSVPGSRQDSEDDEDQYELMRFALNQRSAAAARNRNSMPVTRRDLGARSGIADFENILGPVDTSRFLFGDEYMKSPEDSKPSSRPVSSFLSMQQNGDNFPVLIRSNGEVRNPPNSSSDALDLALTDSQDQDIDSSGWPSSFSRPSTSHASVATGQSGEGMLSGDSPPHALSHVSSPGQTTPPRAVVSNRHSMGAKMVFTEVPRSSGSNGLPNIMANSRMPTKLQTSLSTSSVPTVSSLNSLINPMTGAPSLSMGTAEQRLHQHNASLGRIPASALNGVRQHHDLSASSDGKSDYSYITSPASSSGLHASAVPFGPGSAIQTSQNLVANSNATMFPGQSYGAAYSLQSPVQSTIHQLSGAMQSLSMSQSGHGQWNGQAQGYEQQYNGYAPNGYGQYGAARDGVNPNRMTQQRRQQVTDEPSRYSDLGLDALVGELYGLCKDQHGCRFLQKKLEDRNPDDIRRIFEETNEHIVELMTDPFGNYLCQKLLELATDEQRTVLIRNAVPQMVDIALNQHGTRALQKMIDLVSTPEQIQMVILALKDQVVPMIQDLNGNHVIQKCLNRLSSTDAQFIFDAVANNAVAVGTHRHGCCVIQRCIDHASGKQRFQLVSAITASSLPLVQDPFGNYVIQYIYDQNEEIFTQPLCRTFLGRLAMLSKQKFSSNVIEKCIRVADKDVRHLMIQELINHPNFEQLVDDPFSNYVVQTAWDYASPSDESILAEKIRPMLPRMRHKPYGRRFQTRIGERDKKFGVMPNDVGSGLPAVPMNSYALSPGSSVSASLHSHTLSNDSNLSNIGQAYGGSPSLGSLVHGGPPPLGSLAGGRFMPVHAHPLSTVQYGQYQSSNQDIQQHYGPYGRMDQQRGNTYY